MRGLGRGTYSFTAFKVPRECKFVLLVQISLAEGKALRNEEDGGWESAPGGRSWVFGQNCPTGGCRIWSGFLKLILEGLQHKHAVHVEFAYWMKFGAGPRKPRKTFIEIAGRSQHLPDAYWRLASSPAFWHTNLGGRPCMSICNCC